MPLDTLYSPDLVQLKWREGFVLHVDGITFHDGRVLLIDAKTIRSGAVVRSAVAPLADTTVASVLQYNPEAWVPITRLGSLKWSAEVHVECGEGAMGNEGYVGAVSDVDGSLQWAFFCSRSNPFSELRREGDAILAVGGYDQVWRIPYQFPASLSVE